MALYHSQTRHCVVNEDNEYCNTGSAWDSFAAKLAKPWYLIIKAVGMLRTEMSLYPPYHVFCLYICCMYRKCYTLHRCKLSGLILNSASKSLIRQILMASLILILSYLKTIDHLNMKLLIFIGILQVLRFDFQKFRILEILNFHP